VNFLSRGDPRDHLLRLLAAVGTPHDAAPATIDQLRDEWAEATRAEPVLLVVDDARSEQSVRPLLPAGTESAALLTARKALPGLEGARHIPLDVFEANEAVGFLEAVLGAERVRAEYAAASDIVSLCGLLPLALRISGGQLASRPDLRLSNYADRLRDERTRLEQLAAGDLDVRTSFNVSYGLLSRGEAAVFCSLGWFGGPTVDAAAVAAASGANAVSSLEGLADTQLVSAGARGRYEMHDLLRLFAREQLEAEPAEAQIRSALALAAFYTEESELRAERVHGTDSDSAELPLDWLELESRNLTALLEALVRLEQWKAVIAVSSEAGPLFGAAHAWELWRPLLDQSLMAAERLRDRVAKARFTLNAGIVAANTGDTTHAERCYLEVQRLAEEDDDPGNQARALAQTATLRKMAGEPAEALQLSGRARELYRQDGDVQGEARALGDFANQLDDLDRREEAIAAHEEALALFERLGDRYGQGLELGNLGIAHQRNGDLPVAAAQFRSAAAIFTELGAQLNLLDAEKRLAEVLVVAGRPEEALPILDQGLTRAENVASEREVAGVLALRSRTRDLLGDAEALTDSRRACDLLAGAGEDWGRAVQLVATAMLDNGPGAEVGVALLEEALAVFREEPTRLEPARLAGAAHLAQLRAITGAVGAARSLFEEAVDTARALQVPNTVALTLVEAALFDASSGFAADARKALSELAQLPVDGDRLVELGDFLACEVRVEGTADANTAARVRRPVAQAFAALDWPSRGGVVRLMPPESLSGLGQVNDTEISIQRDLLREPGPDELNLMFLIYGLVAQHVGMRQGIASDGGVGTFALDLIGEWFPRRALGHIFSPDEEPIALSKPGPSDISAVGDNLGAALAGSSRAAARLDEWIASGGADPELISWVSGARDSWGPDLRPSELIHTFATAYRE